MKDLFKTGAALMALAVIIFLAVIMAGEKEFGYPYAEKSADGFVQIVVIENGHEVKLPCEGEWREKFERGELRIEHVAPRWWQERDEQKVREEKRKSASALKDIASSETAE